MIEFLSLRCSGVCKSMHTPHAEQKTLTEQQMQWQQQGRGRWIWVPLTPERSKEESWQQVECEGVYVCKMSLNGMPNTWPLVFGHSPPRQAWIKNILGLFWRFGQFALSKSRKASCNWEKKEDKCTSLQPSVSQTRSHLASLYFSNYLTSLDIFSFISKLTVWQTHPFLLVWVHALYLVLVQKDRMK